MFKQLIIIILIKFSACQDQDFFLENDYIVKPVDSNGPYQIPVILNETVVIICKKLAFSKNLHRIIWDYTSIRLYVRAKSTGTKRDINTDVDQNSIIIKIDNPEIDNKEISCTWKKGRSYGTISVQLKVFEPFNGDVDNSEHCNTCEKGLEITLKRAKIQNKEDVNLEEKVKQKVMKIYNVSASDVSFGSNGLICVCKQLTQDKSDETHYTLWTYFGIGIAVIFVVVIIGFVGRFVVKKVKKVLEDKKDKKDMKDKKDKKVEKDEELPMTAYNSDHQTPRSVRRRQGKGNEEDRYD